MPLMTCPDCGNNVSGLAAACIHCGRPFQGDAVTRVAALEDRLAVEARVANDKKSVAMAYVLLFLFGPFGVHNFYLGRPGRGAFQLVAVLIVLVMFGVAAASESRRYSSYGYGYEASSRSEFPMAVCGLAALAALVSLVIDLFVIPRVVQEHTDNLRKQASARA